MRLRLEKPGAQRTATVDLLKQIEGLDRRLSRGAQLRQLGSLGISLSAAGLAYVAKRVGADDVFQEWYSLVPAVALAVSVVALGLGREWIRESKQPFRYTYSVDPFGPVAGAEDPRLDPLRDWIKADLVLMLSERIGRLSLLPEEHIPADAPDRPASHIHISGSYGARCKDGQLTVELMPLVRIGSACCSATVAHWVRQPLTSLSELTQDRAIYDEILERVYFSVATQIYKQIRLDVDRKISRLPTAYLRATAYFHEAEDYAGSNTLDAFDDASELYTRALELYDRSRRTLPRHRWQRPGQWLLLVVTPRWRRVARRLAWVFPRLGRRDVQIARVRTGYAKALLFRNVLANLSGREPQRVFEARRIVRDAIEDLEKIPDGVAGLKEALFDAQVTAAFAENWALDIGEAKRRLAAARELLPDGDGRALYPLVSAAVEPRLQRRVRLLRRAVELDPRFEIAHFEIAFNLEQLWRTGDELEKEGAELIDRGYESVTILNPANLTAWANRGYVRWLLWDADAEPEAEEVAKPFVRGSRYKEIRQKTFVAELDYGLARIAAEQGNLAKAYEHYTSASGATMAQEETRSYVEYCFDRMNGAMLDRYEKYKERVQAAAEREGGKPEPERLPRRIVDSVLAFALTDWGNACAAYYRRSGDVDCRDEARSALEAALELNPRNLIALRSRADLNVWIAGDGLSTPEAREPLAEAKIDLEALLEQEPRWPPGQLDLVDTELALVQRLIADSSDGQHLAENAESAAKRLFGPESILPKGWQEKAMKIEELARPEGPQPDAILSAVTGPMAAKALALRARANALTKKTERADRLSRFLLAHFVPADYELHHLRLTLTQREAEKNGGADGEIQEVERQLQDIVIRKVELDPGHHYWLRKLAEVGVPDTADSPDEEARTRPRFLRTAVKWPGVPAQTLLWVGGELRNLEEWELSAEAFERAAGDERCRTRAREEMEELVNLVGAGLPELVAELNERIQKLREQAASAAPV